MKIYRIVSIIALLAFFTNCKNEVKENKGENIEVKKALEKSDKIQSLRLNLESKSESSATGVATFTQKGDDVIFRAVLKGLSPGTHAIHIHEKADCSSADGKSSGGHWNPTFKQHGKWGATNGYHKGDIGNFEAKEDGTGMITLTTNEWCIGCDDATKNILGKAIIVHQGTDDFTSQPSGAAGARVSCGGIIQ